MAKKYDVIVIGAGMSGIAAAIRLSMYNKKVLILEQSSRPGGLNSYYERGQIKLDVGLHAMTNFVKKDQKGKPLNKLMRQLRLSYDELQLIPLKKSQIFFPQSTLSFTNEIEFLISEIEKNFPKEVSNFQKLIKLIEDFDETNLENKYLSAKKTVGQIIKDETLLEMIFAPLLIYGSAWENDMDFSQFAIMFKSIFLEGFSRPKGGVRTIIDLLVSKLDCEIQYRKKVEKIIVKDNKAIAVLVEGELIEADKILSSAGLCETMNLCGETYSNSAGLLSFTESILIYDDIIDNEHDIVFFNRETKYYYERPNTIFDAKSAVVCFSNNMIRITTMANYNLWKESREYKKEKADVFENALAIAKKYTDKNHIFKDVFTPLTVERYTSHINGAVYGSTLKLRDGRTKFENLYVIGTDQGFLGIIGAILSGISMANLHCLSD